MYDGSEGCSLLRFAEGYQEYVRSRDLAVQQLRICHASLVVLVAATACSLKAVDPIVKRWSS